MAFQSYRYGFCLTITTEVVNPRGLIGRLTGPNRPDTDFDPVQLFEKIQSVPVSPAELASTYSIPRSTIYRILNPFVEGGLVKRNEDGFRLTGAGKVFLHAYETASQTIDTDLMAFLIASPNRPAVLRRLSEHPARKAELAAAEKSPSRSTVQRILNECDAYELVTRTDDGAYTLTTFGAEVLDAFETLVVAVEQSVEKAAFFNQFGETGVHLPFEPLVNAELVTVTDSDPFAVIRRAAELLEERGNDITRVKGLSPIFNPYIFRLFRDILDDDIAVDVVLTETALTEVRQPRNAEYLTGPMFHPNVDLRIYPERVPYGIGLFDDHLLLVGYANPNENEVAIITDDDRLVEWAEEQFHQYWEKAKPSSKFSSVATRS